MYWNVLVPLNISHYWYTIISDLIFFCRREVTLIRTCHEMISIVSRVLCELLWVNDEELYPLFLLLFLGLLSSLIFVQFSDSSDNQRLGDPFSFMKTLQCAVHIDWILFCFLRKHACLAISAFLFVQCSVMFSPFIPCFNKKERGEGCLISEKTERRKETMKEGRKPGPLWLVKFNLFTGVSRIQSDGRYFTGGIINSPAQKTVAEFIW